MERQGATAKTLRRPPGRRIVPGSEESASRAAVQSGPEYRCPASISSLLTRRIDVVRVPMETDIGHCQDVRFQPRQGGHPKDPCHHVDWRCGAYAAIPTRNCQSTRIAWSTSAESVSSARDRPARYAERASRESGKARITRARASSDIMKNRNSRVRIQVTLRARAATATTASCWPRVRGEPADPCSSCFVSTPGQDWRW